MIERRRLVELIAIGIGHDVTRYYGRAVTITDVEQLAGAMTEQLAALFDNDPVRHGPHHPRARPGLTSDAQEPAARPCPAGTGGARCIMNFTGIGGFILLALDIWALISVIGSNETTGKKVIWVLVILFLPLLGFIAWLIFGPRARASLMPAEAGDEALDLRDCGAAAPVRARRLPALRRAARLHPRRPGAHRARRRATTAASRRSRGPSERWRRCVNAEAHRLQLAGAGGRRRRALPACRLNRNLADMTVPAQPREVARCSSAPSAGCSTR